MLGSLFNKVACLQVCSFIKKRLQHRCFPVNIANYLRTTILKNNCERMLLLVNGLYFILQFLLGSFTDASAIRGFVQRSLCNGQF